jgi:hypothetical protein
LRPPFESCQLAYPALVGAEFFKQQRGLVDFEVKRTDNLMLDLSGFASKVDAGNSTATTSSGSRTLSI